MRSARLAAPQKPRHLSQVEFRPSREGSRSRHAIHSAETKLAENFGSERTR